MRFRIAFAALAVFAAGQAALAGTCYEEQFAAHFAQYDFAWQPTGDPSRFFSSDYYGAIRTIRSNGTPCVHPG